MQWVLILFKVNSRNITLFYKKPFESRCHKFFYWKSLILKHIVL